MVDIIHTVTTIVIMCIAFTGMAVGIIFDQHRSHWRDSATSSVPTQYFTSIFRLSHAGETAGGRLSPEIVGSTE
jgi:hypothetical protein